MFGILVSAINVMLGFLVRSIIVKFVTFFALFFITTGFIAVLKPLLPDASALNGALGSLPATVWYFLDSFAFGFGLKALLSAWVLRFIIRRIPVIG